MWMQELLECMAEAICTLMAIAATLVAVAATMAMQRRWWWWGEGEGKASVGGDARAGAEAMPMPSSSTPKRLNHFSNATHDNDDKEEEKDTSTKPAVAPSPSEDHHPPITTLLQDEEEEEPPITWVATVTTSTSFSTAMPLRTTEEETTNEEVSPSGTSDSPASVHPAAETRGAPPLVTPYYPMPSPTPYASTFSIKGSIEQEEAAAANDVRASQENDQQQKKSEGESATRTNNNNNETKATTSKRRQRRHKSTKVAVEEQKASEESGFPRVDDEILDGAEEGLDPKGPLRLQTCDRFGRYLAAARPLSAGERVLCEGAALLGPRADAAAPGCLRCLRALPRPPPLCASCCAAPLCARCSHADAPFGAAECAWLSGRDGPPPDLCRPRVVLCVRALLLRRSGDRRWERIERLEAHEAARRGGEAWEETRMHVVEPLRAAGLLFPDEDEALLQRISGILDVNTFEVRGGVGGGSGAAEGAGAGGRALFPSAALLAHDCLPSAHVAVDEHQMVHVRAARAIAPGEPLTLCYAAPLQSTAERQEHLLEGKYFRCACSRCRDPEESGTRLGGVRCPKCRSGDLLPPPPPPTAAAAAGGSWWQCTGAAGGSGCGHRAPPQLAATTHARARDLVEEAATAGDERQMEALLSCLRRSLPFHSSPVLTLIQALMASYRSRLQSDVRPSTALLQRQAALARELLSAVSRVAPGDPRLGAVARYELHGALAALAQRRHSATPASARELADGLREAAQELSAAAASLLLEPPASPEGRLGRAAVAQLRELREDISHAESLAAEQEAKRAEAERRRQQRRGGKTTAPAPAPTTPVNNNNNKNTINNNDDGDAQTVAISAPGDGKKKRRRGGGKHTTANLQQKHQQ